MSPFLFTGGLTFQALLYQFGGQLYNDDATKATFNSDAGMGALTWMVDMVKKGTAPRTWPRTPNSPPSPTAITPLCGTASGTSTRSTNQRPGMGRCPLPQIGSQKGAWAGSHNFVIMNKRGQDPNKVAASKVFINWVSQRSEEWAKSGQVPARNSVRDTRRSRA